MGLAVVSEGASFGMQMGFTLEWFSYPQRCERGGWIMDGWTDGWMDGQTHRQEDTKSNICLSFK